MWTGIFKSKKERVLLVLTKEDVDALSSTAIRDFNKDTHVTVALFANNESERLTEYKGLTIAKQFNAMRRLTDFIDEQDKKPNRIQVSTRFPQVEKMERELTKKYLDIETETRDFSAAERAARR